MKTLNPFSLTVNIYCSVKTQWIRELPFPSYRHTVGWMPHASDRPRTRHLSASAYGQIDENADAYSPIATPTAPQLPALVVSRRRMRSARAERDLHLTPGKFCSLLCSRKVALAAACHLG